MIFTPLGKAWKWFGGWRNLTPDKSLEERQEIVASEAFAPHREKLLEKARAQQSLLFDHALEIARANEGVLHKAVDGIGEKVGTIPLAVYAQMETHYGQGCWSDPGFLRSFLRHNPQFSIKTTHGTKGQEYAGRGH